MDKIIKYSPFVLIPLTLFYFYSMVIHPFTHGGWDNAQSVWDRWQSLNVGVLAFLASVIAFYISLYNSKKQRDRDFVAARAFLPDALSSLCDYLQACTTLLQEASDKGNSLELHERIPSSTLTTSIPQLPSNYREIFSRCISLAEPNFGDHLAKILKNLQVNHSRISSLPEEIGKDSNMIVTKQNILDHQYDVGKIRASINTIFDTARGEENFVVQKLKVGDLETAYRNMGINNNPSLMQHTKNIINGNYSS